MCLQFQRLWGKRMTPLTFVFCTFFCGIEDPELPMLNFRD